METVLGLVRTDDATEFNDTTVENISRAEIKLAIRQLDLKRKSHLVQFVYEVPMLRH